MMDIRTNIKLLIRKNYPEFRALVSGKVPGFVYGKELRGDTVPVFVFHEVGPDTFEEKLIYLKENGYKTLDADELLNHLKSSKANDRKYVVLTFDDGHISLWQHAYPLLKKYDFKAVSFICPGLVPDEEKEESISGKRILCNWQEIKQMHDSGHIDFQSHSMYHDLVFTSSKLIDFFNPNFSSYYLGKQEKPVILQDGNGFSVTNLWPYNNELSETFLGLPIFDLAPRLATKERFMLSEEVGNRICDFVKANGDVSFFGRKGWKKTLCKEVMTFRPKETGKTISGKEYQNELEKDLERSKGIIQEKLTGKKVRHLCYPWFETVEESMKTAALCGYASAFLGVDAYFTKQGLKSEYHMEVFQRLPEDYIFLLPGKGRKSFLGILTSKRMLFR